MNLASADEPLLRDWLIKRLASISEADSDVLAEYIIALLKSGEPEPQLRQTCITSLEDFLPQHARKVVDDVFSAVKTRSFDPSHKAPPTATEQARYPESTTAKQARKRGYQDLDAPESIGAPQYAENGHQRPAKQHKRAGRGGRDVHQNGLQRNTFGRQQQQQQQQQVYPPVWSQASSDQPGFPTFDPSDPMAMFTFMQAFASFSGLPPPPVPDPQILGNPDSRCKDYDTKGFCVRGATCPYTHEEDSAQAGGTDEYDPKNATMLFTRQTNPSSINPPKRNSRGKGGDRNERASGRNGRPDRFKHVLNSRRGHKTLIVERIPPEKHDSEQVEEFFREFGEIESVEIRAHQSAAVVRFSTHDGALAAHSSPKPVFDNRFVKVYWYDEIDNDQPTAEDEQGRFSMPEFVAKQEEAQRRHEANQKAIAEAMQRRAEIDTKLNNILMEQKSIAGLLAQKGITNVASSLSATKTAIQAEDSDQTKSLKAQLAQLEAEAKELGIDPQSSMEYHLNNGQHHTLANGQNRGGYSGRGGRYGARGGRGGYSWTAAGLEQYPTTRQPAVKRLDNRSKTIIVTFPDGNINKSSLNELLAVHSIEPLDITDNPDRNDALLVRFDERYKAENFLVAIAGGLPGVGKVDLNWFAGQVPLNLPNAETAASEQKPSHPDETPAANSEAVTDTVKHDAPSYPIDHEGDDTADFDRW